jgi:low temperature requirement protein LtrA
VTDEATQAGAAESVRPLELFFDLVFVFTITQVASVLTALPTILGLGGWPCC